MNFFYAMKSIFYAFFSLFIVCSCTPLPQEYPEGCFSGVQETFKEQKELCLFITHGAGGFSDGDPKDVRQTIARQLNVKPIKEPEIYPILDISTNRHLGCLEKHIYQGRCSNDKLRIYILDWRKSTWDEKELLRREDFRNCLPERQVSTIRKWREGFIIENLGDALMAMGASQKQVMFTFEQSLKWIYEDTKEIKDLDISIITFSLGGQLVLDAFEEMKQSNNTTLQETREYFIQKNRTFFALSNFFSFSQLHRKNPEIETFIFQPKLELCSCCSVQEPLTVTHPPKEINWSDTALGHYVLDRRNVDEDFQIVSFSDPNDLLTSVTRAPLKDYEQSMPRKDDLIVNVLTRNSKLSLGNSIVHPARAHQNYGENKEVLCQIVYGVHQYKN